MGRPRKTDRGLPARVYRHHGAYYYVRPGDNAWLRLGETEPEMLAALARLKADQADRLTLGTLFDRYAAERLPTKALRTRQEQTRQLETLRAVFGNMPPGSVKPHHIARYLDSRPAKVAGNREIALLSAVYRAAIRWGLADKNPCVGVELNKEKPRTRYVSDAEFLAVRTAGNPTIQALMDLAFLTGQRLGDIIHLHRAQCQPDGIHVAQRKTGARLVITWTPALRAAVDRAMALHEPLSSLWIISTEKGQRYSESGIKSLWQRHIRHCHEIGLIAERFTLHDLRAKARSDGPDARLLGHLNPDAMARVYQRKPISVRPAG